MSDKQVDKMEAALCGEETFSPCRKVSSQDDAMAPVVWRTGIAGPI